MKTKFALFIFTIVGLSTFQLFGQSNIEPLTEEEVLDTIWNLMEVQERNEYVVKKSDGKRKLKLLIYQKSNETENKYYWIKVAEDNGSNFVSHYNFFVYPKNRKIMYLNTLTGNELELSEWRKKR